jgi:translation elongation factor EF-1beta
MSKVPEVLPTFLVKAMWRATAIKMKVVAKDEEDAWDKAAKLVKKMEGGSSCIEIKVMGTI